MEILIGAIIIGLIPAFIAQKKGYDFFQWWVYGAALFIVALPAILLKSPKEDDDDIEKPRSAPRGQRLTGTPKWINCPECNYLIADVTKPCVSCGTLVTSPTPAVEPSPYREQSQSYVETSPSQSYVEASQYREPSQSYTRER